MQAGHRRGETTQGPVSSAPDRPARPVSIHHRYLDVPRLIAVADDVDFRHPTRQRRAEPVVGTPPDANTTVSMPSIVRGCQEMTLYTSTDPSSISHTPVNGVSVTFFCSRRSIRLCHAGTGISQPT